MAAHDWLDLPGDAVERRPGGGRVGLGLESTDLPHLVQVAHPHRRPANGGQPDAVLHGRGRFSDGVAIQIRSYGDNARG